MINLTEQQKAIVEHTGNSLVVASAGSGKTSTSIAKIKHLKEKEPNCRILYITFTRMAKAHAIEKLGKADNVLITNFHSLAYMTLLNHKAILKINEIDIVNTSYCLSILRSFYPEDGAKELRDKLSAISLAKVECSTPDEMGSKLKSVYIQFQSALNIAKKYVFDDLLVEFVGLLQNNLLNESFRNSILKFDYIICDEVNDTNRIQFKMIEELVKLNPTAKIMFVGDLVQSIYGFRGARPDLVVTYANKFNMDILPLTVNFRSQEAIIDLGNANLDLMEEFNEFIFKMNYSKPRGSDIIRKIFIDKYNQYDYVAEKIKEFHASGYKYGDIRLLFRMNISGTLFEKVAIKNKIPFKLLKGSLLDRKIVIYLMNCIKLADGLIKGLPDKTLNYYLKEFAFEIAPDIGIETYKLVFDSDINMNFFTKLQHIDKLNIKGVGAVKKAAFKTFFKELNIFMDIYQNYKNDHKILILKLGERLLQFKHFRNYNQMQFESVREDITEFNSIINEMEGDILEKLNIITIEYSSFLKTSDNAVLGMTVHQAKGTEAKIVFIIDFENFPIHFIQNYDDQINEEKRIMYVAITRAEDQLVLTSTGENRYERCFKKHVNYDK